MKNLFLFLTLFFMAQTKVVASTLIVTDIDDTIKDTQVLHKKALAKKAPRINLPFKGMSELYHHLVNEEKNKETTVHMVYLSNAPEKGFGKLHRSFLRVNNFPAGTAYLRRNVFDQNHKFNTLDHLLKTLRPTRVILIGDNGEKDALVYHQAKEKLFPKYGVKSDQVFIRFAYPSTDKGKAIYEGQYSFLNAADIALTLFRLEYLSPESTQDVFLKSVVQRLDGMGVEPVLPRWIDCREFYKMGLSPFQKTPSEREKGLLAPHFELNFEALRYRCDRTDFVYDDDDDDDDNDDGDDDQD